MSPPDTFRRRLQAAADAFRVPDDVVNIWMTALAGQGSGGSRPTYLSGVQGAAILRVAAVHHAECVAASCPTCEELVEVLAVLLAAQQLNDIDQFRLIVNRLA